MRSGLNVGDGAAVSNPRALDSARWSARRTPASNPGNPARRLVFVEKFPHAVRDSHGDLPLLDYAQIAIQAVDQGHGGGDSKRFGRGGIEAFDLDDESPQAAGVPSQSD